MAELGSRRRTSRKAAAARSRSAFAECAKPGVESGHVVGGIGSEDFSNWARPSSARPLLTRTKPRLLRASRLAGERDRAAVGFEGGRGVAGALASEPELVPRFRRFWIDRCGALEVRDRGFELRCRVECLAEVEAVVEMSLGRSLLRFAGAGSPGLGCWLARGQLRDGIAPGRIWDRV